MSEKTPSRQTTYQQRYRSLPLAKKLLVIIAGSSLLMASLAMFASFFIELNFFRNRLLEEYTGTARMLSTNLEAAVAFEDERDASDLLGALRKREFVSTAAVYLRDGTMLASYRHPDLDARTKAPEFSTENELGQDFLTISEPISIADKPIGRLVLRANLGETASFLTTRAWMLLAVLGPCFLLSVYLAARLGRRFSLPIQELASTAQRITEHHDFTTRQKRVSDDETGKLVDAFNEMIAEIGAREQEILKAKEKAEASSRAKDDFLSVVSHELRTPLNPIIGYVEILLRRLSDAEDKKQLGLVKQYAEHLQGLIDNVIDYTRIERVAHNLNKEPVDYRRLCQTVIELLKRDAEKKGIALNCSHSFANERLEGRSTILSDRVKLQQVFLNLVTNSLKFTDSGSISLTTRLSENETGATSLLVEVADTGIGIAEADREKIFKPFSQIDESLTRQHAGMGLGLAITQKIVKAMDGHIDFSSERGVGSTFVIELPVELSEIPELDPARVVTTLSSSSDTKGRVLLVDDQMVNLELAESLLTDSGQDVVCARSGAEAIEKAKQEIFSLIILDIKMPKMSGYETAERLRELERNRRERTPIIAMTAHVTTRGSEQCFEAGMDDFLAKPFNTEKLNLILSKWLRVSPKASSD